MMLNLSMRNWWKILFFVASIGIILSWVASFVFQNSFRATWKAELMTPLYFTYISNTFALVLGFIKGFTKLNKRVEVKVIEVFAFVNLAVTFIVYWAILFPTGMPKTAISWSNDMVVHFVTPLLTITLFIIQNKKFANSYKFNALKNSAFHFIFVLFYFSMALILYYSLGAHKEDAIYNFLDFAHNPWYVSVMVVIGIAVAYLGITFGTYKFINKFAITSK